MKNLVWVALAVLALSVSCSRKTGPAPLTLEQVPAALRTAFQPAKLLTKQNAESVAKMVEAKQLPGAAIQLQAILAQDLNEAQRDVASAALQAVNQALQELAASVQPPEPGAQAPRPVAPAKAEEAAAAAEVMQHYIRTK